jgi:hypothetical protein
MTTPSGVSKGLVPQVSVARRTAHAVLRSRLQARTLSHDSGRRRGISGRTTSRVGVGLDVMGGDRVRSWGGGGDWLCVPGLAPDFEDGGDVAEEDARHLAPLVHLSDTGCPLLMVDRNFMEREAVAMGARYELPPEAFFHFAEFACHDFGD